MENFGTRVRRLRLARGYETYPAADRKTGVPAATWENMESRGKDPYLSTIQAIRDALGVTTSELLDGVSGPGAAQGGPVPRENPPRDTPPTPRPRRRRGA